MRTTACAAKFAERQLGLVTRDQLLDEGLPASTIESALAEGRLAAEARGVYRIPGAPSTPHSRLLAEVLAAGPGALASHRTAAWLWGLCDPPAPHEVTVPIDRRLRPRGVQVHRSRDLALATPGLVHGVPVTGVGRTLLDCASDPSTDVQLLVDAARRHHRISRTLLPHVLLIHARPGRPGIAALRAVVELDELPDSDFERLFCRWLRSHGVDGWLLHHRIVVPGFGPVALDLAWPALQVALELEGADHRDRRTVHDRDTERQNRLALAGWVVLRTTYRRWLRHPEAVLDELRRALEHAGRPLRGATPPA